MPNRAHLLIQVQPGRSDEAARYLSALPAVAQAVVTSGAYDVIATVDADSEDTVRGTMARARRTPGLSELRLCRSQQPSPALQGGP